jgi:hypothetical protein
LKDMQVKQAPISAFITKPDMGMEVRIIRPDMDVDTAGDITGGGGIIIIADIVIMGITTEGRDISGAVRLSYPGTRTVFMLPHRLSSRKSPRYMFNRNKRKKITGTTVQIRRVIIRIFDNARADG